MPITYNIKVKKNEIIIIILILIIIMMIGTASIMRREFDNIKHQHKCEINSFRKKADYRLFFL